MPPYPQNGIRASPVRSDEHADAAARREGPQRRHFLAASVAASLLWGGRSAASPQTAIATTQASRVVVLDWGLVETILALGMTPVGVAEIQEYGQVVPEPGLPDGVIDVGLRLAPNLELLQELAPDLILINSSQGAQKRILERIAPTMAIGIYTPEGRPYQHAQSETLRLAKTLGREEAGRTTVATVEAAIERARIALQGHAGRPLYLIRFTDARHVAVYGPNSLFQDVLDRMKVSNAWQGKTNYWGVTTAGLEQLVGEPEARLLVIGPMPPGVEKAVAASPLWQDLPFVRARRVTLLPPFWPFGGLPTAARFAQVLPRCLLAREAAHG